MPIILRLDRIMADRKMSLNELSEKVGVANATAVAEFYGLSKRIVSDDYNFDLIRGYSAYFVPGEGGEGNVTFYSSDNNVAFVIEDGLITAVNGGTAQITYSYEKMMWIIEKR